jgi:hypothetical protein
VYFVDAERPSPEQAILELPRIFNRRRSHRAR